MTLAELTFRQSVGLEAWKAFLTAVLVVGGATWLVNRAQDRAETQRTKREHDLQLDQARRSAKMEFVRRATELAGGFYFVTQRYQRQHDKPELWGEANPAEFDSTYITWATACEALLSELEVRYGLDSKPAITWHQVRDLLTVRYFTLRGGEGLAGLLRKNARDVAAKQRHSGLTEKDLADAQKVVATYKSAMATLGKELQEEKVSV